MLTILIYSGIIALVLLVLYLVARRIPVFGDSLAFLCVFAARVLVTLQGMFERAGNYSYEVFERSLCYPAGVARDAWHGVLVISRNIILAVSSIILTADIYNMLQRLPLLFGGAGAVDLPGSFAIPSSLLFVCMTALYGAVVLECVDLLPYGAGLFPRMREKVKKWLGIFCAIGLGLSLLFAVLFWVTSGYYISVDPSTPAWLSIPALAIVGIILTGASVLALWGLVIGLTGLCSVVFWLLSFGFSSVAGFVSLVPELLNVLSMFFTSGRRSVRVELGGHDRVNPPASPFSPSQLALPGQKTTALLPETSSADDAEREEVVPIQTTVTEVPMTNPENASIVLVGSFGTKMRPHFEQKIKELQATGSFRSMYYLDLSVTHVQTGIGGMVDLSPTYAERKAVLLHEETEDQAYRKLFRMFDDKLVETHIDAKAYPDSLIFVIDPLQLVDCVEMLESISRRLSLHSLVVVTELDEYDLQNKTVQVGVSDMQSLVAEDFIETVLVSSQHSPFAAQYGIDTQHTFLAHTVIGLVLSQKHSLKNPSFVNVLHNLHSLSPFTAVSFASEGVALGSMPKRYWWLPLAPGSAGSGNYGDILAQTRTAIDRCVTEDDTRTFSSQVSLDAGCVILNSEPIRLDDERFALSVRDNALFVGKHYPYATSITVRGNGTPYPNHLGSRFLVQSSCLYPFQPTSLQQMYEGRTKVTPLYPVTTTLDPTGTNGHIPTQEQTGKTETTKAVATTRQKKVAPARRISRKNTKQAAK